MVEPLQEGDKNEKRNIPEKKSSRILQNSREVLTLIELEGHLLHLAKEKEYIRNLMGHWLTAESKHPRPFGKHQNLIYRLFKELYFVIDYGLEKKIGKGKQPQCPDRLHLSPCGMKTGSILQVSTVCHNKGILLGTWPITPSDISCLQFATQLFPLAKTTRSRTQFYFLQRLQTFLSRCKVRNLFLQLALQSWISRSRSW